LLELRANHEKQAKLEELRERLRVGDLSAEEFREKEALESPKWDSKLLLAKQRYPGSRQNASKFMWFDRASLQFRDKYEEGPVDYLL
jgi:hypothetical protein